jgi:hypothetical protein
MPTPPPPPVEKPKDEEEKLARREAVEHINKIFSYLSGYAYGTRSHMPGGLDYTDFTNALQKVRKFCNIRPDWMLQIMKDIELEPVREIMRS